MQHVDDALLVAYADDALAAAERRSVDEHLAGCAECRERVAEERALARRADQVLGAAVPATSAVPPFEDVMRRRSAPSSPARGAWMPLAWAASLVIAIGAGWMANELLLSPELQAPMQRAAESGASAAQSPLAAEDADATSQTAGVESQAAATEPQPDVQRARSEAARTGAATSQQARAPEQEAAEAPAPESSPEPASSPAAPPSPALALEEIVVTGNADAQQKAARAEGRRTDARSELAAVAYAPADAVVAMELNAGDVVWRGTDVSDAPLDGVPVRGVADVAIDSVWVASDSADWRARVLQRLEAGPLEVIEWRRSPWQGVIASGTLPDGRRYLLGRSDSVLVELRARLDADTLEALLARVRPLR